MVQAETSFDVYVAFSDELQRAQAGQLAVLDDDDGLVTRWSIICDQKYALSPLGMATGVQGRSWSVRGEGRAARRGADASFLELWS